MYFFMRFCLAMFLERWCFCKYLANFTKAMQRLKKRGFFLKAGTTICTIFFELKVPVYIYIYSVSSNTSHTVAALRPLLGDTLSIHLHAIHQDHSYTAWAQHFSTPLALSLICIASSRRVTSNCVHFTFYFISYIHTTLTFKAHGTWSGWLAS